MHARLQPAYSKDGYTFEVRRVSLSLCRDGDGRNALWVRTQSR